MKKSYLIILIVVILVGAGLAFYFTGGKECKDLNEQECKKDDRCLSTLIPCTDPTCTSDAVFKECKDKK
ncbi:MAG: hypothetical protein ABIH38_03365 [Patescibacteria group bacterium]